MAKKKNELDVDDVAKSNDNDGLDDLDLDIGLDENVDGNRNPISKLSTGFVEGALQSSTDTNEISRRIKVMLPDEYSDVVDASELAASSPRELYNTIVNQSREGIKGVKKLGDTVIKKHGDKLPKGLKSHLESMVAQEDKSRYPSKDEIEEENIQNSIASIFDAKEQVDQARDIQQSGQETARHLIRDQRDADQNALLSGIYQATHRQVQYQDTVLARYQRQSLKLQYRQLYVSRDSLSVLERFSADAKEALAGILKNTGLPDYQKITLGEAGIQQFRDRVLGDMQNSFAERTGNFLGNLKDTVFKKFGERIKSASDSIAQLASGSEMLMDMDDMGGSPEEQAGSAAGGFFANKGINTALKAINKRFGDNDLVQGKLSEIQQMLREAPELLEQQAKDGTLIPPSVPGHRMWNEIIAESIPEAGVTSNITRQGIESSLDAAIFDQLTRRSIVEIIPGYLSRIQNEIYQLRTGDSDPDSRVEFNIEKGRFDTRAQIKEDVKGSLFNKEKEEKSQEKILGVIDDIDPSGNLSVNARQQLGLHLLEQAEKGTGRINTDALAQGKGFSDSVSQDSRDEIQNVIRQTFDYKDESYTDDDGYEQTRSVISNKGRRKRNNTSKLFTDLKTDLKNLGPQLEAYAQIGQRELLREMNFLTEKEDGSDDVNLEELRESRLSGDWEKRLSDDEKIAQNIETRKRALQRLVKEAEEEAYLLERERVDRLRREATPMGQKIKGFKDGVSELTGRGVGKLKQTGERMAESREGQELLRIKEAVLRDEAQLKGKPRIDLSRRTVPNPDDLTGASEFTPTSDATEHQNFIDQINRAYSRGVSEAKAIRNERSHVTEVEDDDDDDTLTDYSDAESPVARKSTLTEQLSENLSKGADRVTSWYGDLMGGKDEETSRGVSASGEEIAKTDDEATDTVLSKAKTFFNGASDKAKAFKEDIEKDTRYQELVKSYHELKQHVDDNETLNAFKEDFERTLANLTGQFFDEKVDSGDYLDTKAYADWTTQASGDYGQSGGFDPYKETLSQETAFTVPANDGRLGDTLYQSDNSITNIAQAASNPYQSGDGNYVEEDLLRNDTTDQTASELTGSFSQVRKQGEKAVNYLQSGYQGVTDRLVVPNENETGDTPEVEDGASEANSELLNTFKLLSKKLSSTIERGVTVNVSRDQDDTGRGPDRSSTVDAVSLRDTTIYPLVDTGDTSDNSIDSYPTTDSRDSTDKTEIKTLIREFIDLYRRNSQEVNRSVSEIRDKLREEDDVGSDPQAQRLLESLEQLKEVTRREDQTLLLTRILKTLEANVAASGGGEDKVSKGIFKRTASLIGTAAKGTIKASGRGLGKFYGGVFDGIGGLASGIGRGVGGLASGVGRGIGGKVASIGRRSPPVDIYLEGDDEPVLNASEMRKKVYFDSETGQPIKSPDALDNLQGNVITYGPDGEPEVVVTREELSNGIYDYKGKPIGEVKGPGIIGKTLSGLGSLYGAYTKPLKAASDLIGKTGRGIGNFINRPIDVYVKGESEPRLLARIFNTSGYVSGATGNPIYHHNEIDGPVLPLVMDDEGPIDPLLTLEDMAKGLVDINGNPVELSSRIKAQVAKLAKAPLKAAKWVFDRYADAAKWGVSTLGNVLDKVPSSEKRGVIDEDVSNEQLDTIKEIRDMLKKRFGLIEERYEEKVAEEEEKEVREEAKLKDLTAANDENPYDDDGDGDRDGGWRDIFQRRREARKESKEEKDAPDEPEESSGGNGRLLGLLGAVLTPLASTLTGVFKGGVDMLVSGFTGVLDGFKSLLEMWAAKRLADGVGGAAGGRGPGGRPSRARRAGGLLKKAAKGLGRFALMAPGLLKGAALGAGAVLTSPVALVVAGTAAITVGGYLLWSDYRKDSYGEIESLRFNQYGLTIEDEYAKALYLEEVMADYVTYDGDGGAVFKEDMQLDPEQSQAFFEKLGVDPTDSEQTNRFLDWFAVRFTPIYLTHKSGLRQISKNYKLEDIDQKLSDLQKSKFLASVRNIQYKEYHPYSVHQHPFNIGSISITAEEIQKRFDALMDKYLTSAEEEAKTIEMGSSGFGPGQGYRQTQASDTREEVETLRSEYEAQDNSFIEQQDKGLEVTLERQVFTGETIRVRQRANDTLDALEAIRYKAYGLKSMDADKVTAIRELEEEIFEYVTFSENKGVSLDLGNYDPASNHYSNFGISFWQTGMQAQWREWFYTRFLNVFLSYLGGVKATQGNFGASKVEVAINPRHALEIANTLISLTVETDDGNVSVWKLTVSPFKNYTLNSDARSTAGNLRAIAKHIEEKTLDEENSQEEKTDKESGDTTTNEETGRTDPSQAILDRQKAIRNNYDTGGRKDIQGGQTSSWSSSYSAGSEESTTGRGVETAPISDHQRQKITETDGYESVIKAMAEMDITDPTEQAMLLAQTNHESGGFRHLEEGMSYGADRLMKVFGRDRLGGSMEVVNRIARNPEATANVVYGGEFGRKQLGNTEPGDGWKYRGRGFIQLSGRGNYQAASDALGVDLINNPDKLLEPELAAKASVWWWKQRFGGELRQAARRGDLRESTRLVNGGYNGIDDRRQKFGMYQELIQDGTVAEDIAEAKGIKEPTLDKTAIASANTVAEEAARSEAPGEGLDLDQGGSQLSLGQEAPETPSQGAQGETGTNTSTTSPSVSQGAIGAAKGVVAANDEEIHPDEPLVVDNTVASSTPPSKTETPVEETPPSRKKQTPLQSRLTTQQERGVTPTVSPSTTGQRKRLTQTAIEAASGVSGAPTRDAEAIAALKRREQTQASIRQQQSGENDTRVVRSLEDVTGIMNRSLDTQISMNSTLGEVLAVLKDQRVQAGQSVASQETQPTQRSRDTSTADRITNSRERNRQNQDTPNDVSDGVIPVTKGRYA